jgi:hypothetical protein
MKAHVAALMLISFVAVGQVDGNEKHTNRLGGAAREAWETQTVLKAVEISAETTMGEYEAWAHQWKTRKRGGTNDDRTINVMAESTFIIVQMALEAHPHPQLLERCLLFLGTTVPPEFDDWWRSRILEMADVDKIMTAKVNEVLKSKNLPTLSERAMGRQ